MKFKNFYFEFPIVFIVTIYFFYFSPNILGQLQPDSLSFTKFHSTRTSIYPYIYSLFSYFNLNLIFFQKALLLLSILSIYFALLSKNFDLLTRIVFLSLVIFNIYYTSFSETILAESIFFSFINFSFSGIILLSFLNNFLIFLLGISIGFILTIKHSGLVLGILLLIGCFYILLKNKRQKSFWLILMGAMLVVFVENSLFYSKYSSRNSVLKESINGKVIFLSGKDSFVVEEYPKEYREILFFTKKELSSTHKFLEKIKNPILRSDLTADYEVISQYQVSKLNNGKDISFTPLEKTDILLFYKLLKNNFFDYISLSLSHFVGLWSAGSKTIFIKKFDSNEIKNFPLKELLENASGPIKSIDIKLLNLANIFFLLSFILFNLITLLLIKKIIQKRKINELFLITVFTSQFYLLFIAFTNIASIRYLMPVYPFIIVTIIFYFKSFIVKTLDHLLKSRQ